MKLKAECESTFDIAEYVFDQHEMRLTGNVHVEASLLNDISDVGPHQSKILQTPDEAAVE
jgi:hypothetical protein